MLRCLFEDVVSVDGGNVVGEVAGEVFVQEVVVKGMSVLQREIYC